MQRRWQVRRQVERQRSQYYSMPGVQCTPTRESVWRAIQDSGSQGAGEFDRNAPDRWELKHSSSFCFGTAVAPHRTAVLLGITPKIVPYTRFRFIGANPTATDNFQSPALHQLLNERTSHIGRYPRVPMQKRACVQYWFGSMQGRKVGALKELSDRDFVTPKQGFFDG